MELPSPLRRAVDDVLQDLSLADLTRAAAGLSARYRSETADGAFHIADDLAARAYLAVRLPATYAAIRDAMARVSSLHPDFSPSTFLDAGAGPGTALWAAADGWPGLADALMIEASGAIRQWGERLCASAPVGRVTWQSVDLTRGVPGTKPRDLVCLAYVLGELSEGQRPKVIDHLWSLTDELLLLVEPGTPAGWQRILAARQMLIDQGAHILAPCPHLLKCPLSPPDWCHFSRRVARSRLHRLVKQADVPWEDEKFIYLAAVRRPGPAIQARVIAPPRASKGRISLKLCCADGAVAEPTVSKRDGDVFKTARRCDWGDVLQVTRARRPE